MKHAPNLSKWALRHRALTWFAMATVLVAGAFSYAWLGRNEDPSFTVKVMVVQASWPGATINDMLQQVTERIEKKVQETPGLDYVRSYTAPGQTTVLITLKESVPSRDVPDTWYQVRKKVADIKHTLPQGLVGPFFNDEFGSTYGIIYAFTADGFTQRELRDHVEAARSRLLHVPDVAKIDIFGAQDEKIYIEFSVQKLAGLRINPMALIQALQVQNTVTPAGSVQTSEEKIHVDVTGGFRSEADLRQVNFVADGQIFRLADFATIKRSYADPPQPMFRINGEPAIALAISMRAGGDMLALGRNVERAMAGLTADLPVGIEARLVAEQPKIVKGAVNEFALALWEAIAIVLAVSFLTLGLRAGAVVAVSIPIVLAIVFVFMGVAGIDLQRVSLGALIISLGLLVDDAMITVESMMSRLEAGCGKAESAIFAYTSTAFPMLTGTLVTVAGFIPIGFAKSTAGEYTSSLFAVVAVALLASWVVAVLFSPLVGTAILPAKMNRKQDAAPGLIMRGFRRLLEAAMRAKWLTIGSALALFGLSLIGLRYVPLQFFPSSDRPELLVDFRLAEDSSIYVTDQTVAEFERLLTGDDDVERWSSYVGQGAIRFYLPLDVQLPNDFFAQAVIVTKSLAARERVRARLEQAFAEKFPAAITRVYALELGPPVGWPVQYRISGPDLSQLREIAHRVAAVVSSDHRAQKINFDWIEPQRTLRIRVDQDQARLLGVSSLVLAQTLNAVISGMTVTQMRDGIYLIEIVARGEAEDRTSPTRLRTLTIPLPNGKTVPLVQLATLEYDQSWPLVWRRDRVPTLTVQADVAPGTLPAGIVGHLRPDIDKMRSTLPPGYAITEGGSVEKSSKSLGALVAALPVAALVMMIVLMMQLQSVGRMLLVLSVAPLGLVGVVAALLLSQKPLGFVAILGIVALVGMIVRNSVILVDQIEKEMARGQRPWDAVVEATLHRFRPILLTAAAAIFGMIPIASTVFWGPMAYAIMGGLTVATALTLVFLPALYVACFRIGPPDQASAIDRKYKAQPVAFARAASL